MRSGERQTCPPFPCETGTVAYLARHLDQGSRNSVAGGWKREVCLGSSLGGDKVVDGDVDDVRCNWIGVGTIYVAKVPSEA